jgi:hypothetical protein
MTCAVLPNAKTVTTHFSLAAGNQETQHVTREKLNKKMPGIRRGTLCDKNLLLCGHAPNRSVKNHMYFAGDARRLWVFPLPRHAAT